MSEILDREIERAGRTIDLWNRVHGELEDGKQWGEIDNGLRTIGTEYGPWRAYMESRMRHILQSIVLIKRKDTNR